MMSRIPYTLGGLCILTACYALVKAVTMNLDKTEPLFFEASPSYTWKAKKTIFLSPTAVLNLTEIKEQYAYKICTNCHNENPIIYTCTHETAKTLIDNIALAIINGINDEENIS